MNPLHDIWNIELKSSPKQKVEYFVALHEWENKIGKRCIKFPSKVIVSLASNITTWWVINGRLFSSKPRVIKMILADISSKTTKSHKHGNYLHTIFFAQKSSHHSFYHETLSEMQWELRPERVLWFCNIKSFTYTKSTAIEQNGKQGD